MTRMSAIADTFGALTDACSYKPVFPEEKAFANLENMDTAIDQNMLAMLMKIFSSTRNEEKEKDLVEAV